MMERENARLSSLDGRKPGRCVSQGGTHHRRRNAYDPDRGAIWAMLVERESTPFWQRIGRGSRAIALPRVPRHRRQERRSRLTGRRVGDVRRLSRWRAEAGRRDRSGGLRRGGAERHSSGRRIESRGQYPQARRRRCCLGADGLHRLHALRVGPASRLTEPERRPFKGR